MLIAFLSLQTTDLFFEETSSLFIRPSEKETQET